VLTHFVTCKICWYKQLKLLSVFWHHAGDTVHLAHWEVCMSRLHQQFTDVVTSPWDIITQHIESANQH